MQLTEQQRYWGDSVSNDSNPKQGEQRNIDLYEIDAHYYDEIHDSWDSDLNFWVPFANRIKGELLEIGGGTGRITIRLTVEGHSVTSVEPSQSMRSIAKKKLLEKKLEAKFIEAKLPDAPLPPGKYSATLLPADVFLYCKNKQEQELTLFQIYNSLTYDGVVALDLPGPALGLAPEKNGESIIAFETENPEGHLLKVQHICYDDVIRKPRKLTIQYETSTGNEESTHELLYVSLEEMRALLEITGFEIANIYGDYSLDSYTPRSERMIIVAKKRAN